MTKKRGLNKMVRGILAWMAVMLMSMQMGTMAETVDSEAVFTKNGVSCDAFWPGNTIAATAQVVGDGSFDKAWVLLALKSNAGTLVKQISVTPVEIKNGINVVKGSIEIPSETDGDILEAYCLKEGKLGALTLKSTISKGTGAEPVQRYTAVDPEAWGFETNSLGGEDDGKDWTVYEIARNRSDRKSYCGIDMSLGISTGTATIISTADASETANVKDGAFAAKLVGVTDTVESGTVTARSFVGIGKSYTQLAENCGKLRTIEGYMKIDSLESDARVRLVLREGSLKAEGREISNYDLDVAVRKDQFDDIMKGRWIHVQLTVPNVRQYNSISLGLELVGEGKVYFDGFRLLEDTNLITNGSFAMGDQYNHSKTDRKKIHDWEAAGTGQTQADIWTYFYRYDFDYECVRHLSETTDAEDACLYQNANAFTRMITGQTYEISLAYSGTKTPTVILGDTPVKLKDSGKTSVRGADKKEFKIYTAEYTLPVGAAVPEVYKLTTGKNDSGADIVEYFADFSIYPQQG